MATPVFVCPGCLIRFRANRAPHDCKYFPCPQCGGRLWPLPDAEVGAQQPAGSRRRHASELVGAVVVLIAAVVLWGLVSHPPTPTARPGRAVVPVVALSELPPVLGQAGPVAQVSNAHPAPIAPVAQIHRLPAAKHVRQEPDGTLLARGRELFLREWLPNDSRSHGGDGLGPVFNDSSCVACHSLGGTGGGGPNNKNVEILTVAGIDPRGSQRQSGRQVPPSADRDGLGEIHPAFRTAQSVVLHRFGTDPGYERWRIGWAGIPALTPGQRNDGRSLAELELTKRGVTFNGRRAAVRKPVRGGSDAIVTLTRRNPTALFGLGVIDAVPDAVIDAGAGAEHHDFPEIKGRVSLLEGGGIGRFGWKAQTATLNDFVLTACAVELGLDVPAHPQGGDPRSPEARAPGLDLTEAECDALVAYVGSLPAPSQQMPPGAESEAVDAGEALFASVGCAACHAPQLGDAKGIYSDLLLHDMGQETGDTGSYSPFRPQSPGDSTPPSSSGILAQSAPGNGGIVSANRREWRTPPLWGVRDSGPYMHDGRADTLEQAIAVHGGEAANTASRYFALPNESRGLVLAFLKSLAAPAEREPIAVARARD